MLIEGITPANVIKAARYLLALDTTAIDEQYRLDLNHWTRNLHRVLEQCLRHYHMPLEKKPTGWAKVDLVDYHLQSLIKQVHAFLPLLTPEALDALKYYLKHLPKSSRNKVPNIKVT